MSVPFVHLRVHSEFSLVDGLVRIKPLAKALAGMNMPAVAITDQSNMCSLVKFYKTAMGAGIKPICGADLWLAAADPEAPLSRICFLAMNPKGYRNLTELISRGAVIPDAGANPAVDKVVFSLASGAVSDPIVTDTGAIIVKVVERSVVKDAELTTAKDGLKREMIAERQNRFFSSYMTKAKEKLRIETYPQTIARVLG